MNSKKDDPLLEEITRLEKVMGSMEAELDSMENDLFNGVDVDQNKIKILMEQITCTYKEFEKCKEMHDNGGSGLMKSLIG